jgi:hypothetical protein
MNGVKLVEHFLSIARWNLSFDFVRWILLISHKTRDFHRHLYLLETPMIFNDIRLKPVGRLFICKPECIHCPTENLMPKVVELTDVLLLAIFIELHTNVANVGAEEVLKPRECHLERLSAIDISCHKKSNFLFFYFFVSFCQAFSNGSCDSSHTLQGWPQTPPYHGLSPLQGGLVGDGSSEVHNCLE